MSQSDHHRLRRTGAARGFQLQRSDLVILSLLVSRRVGSSMVEQRPFKALVLGSSPSQPTSSLDRFDGVGLHTSGFLRALLHWFD